MKQLSNEELMDYMDGALGEARQAEVEAHLASCPADAQLLSDLRMAQVALVEWDAHELQMEAARPNRGDFWVKVREQLPLEEKRTMSLASRIGAWLWPANSPVMRGAIAAIVAILALLATWLGPMQTQHRVQAGPNAATRVLTPEEKAAINSRQAPRRDGVVAPGSVDRADSADRE